MTRMPPDGQIDLADFRRALGCFVTGVTVITTRAPSGEPVGLTANSFNSVSLDPPLVVWSLSQFATSLPAFQGSDRFAVNVLAAGQRELSQRFAARLPDRFEGVAMQEGLGGMPLLEGVAACFECRNEYRYYGGDHVIFIGRVERYVHCDRPPLVFCRGQYRELTAD